MEQDRAACKGAGQFSVMKAGELPSDENLPVPSGLARNPGMALDLEFLHEAGLVNRSAVERRVASLTRRRSIKGANQLAWLLRALSLMDLTSLDSSDTQERIRRLCVKAWWPLRTDLTAQLQLGGKVIRPAALCVYQPFVETAVEVLHGSGVKVAAVSTAFPHGLAPLSTRRSEIRACVAAGADEIDIVIPRSLVFEAQWDRLYDEIGHFREDCGAAHLKVILGTGDLSSLRNVARAAMVAMMAGADFVKTSTGKESLNATLPVGLVMLRMIRSYHEKTGYKIGFKPAGGISTARSALDWLVLIREEMGSAWLKADLFRFGASSLLGDIERQIEHGLTGRYAASWRHAIG